MDPSLETQEGKPRPTRKKAGLNPDDFMPPPDPLLQSDAYIEVDTDAVPLRTQVAQPESEPGMTADTVTDQAADSSQRRARRKQVSEESVERPSWLPENWKMDVRVRNSGATAGTVDRYYIDPVSGKRFRSSKEVLHYLETGSKRKPSESPGANPKQQKKSSSSTKETKPTPFYFDFENPPQNVSWVHTSTPGDNWAPHSIHGIVPECIQTEWSTVFSSVTKEMGQNHTPPKDRK
ncbi:unnamed protein product [Cuscuta campestris]|uniref:MBD domain-containing protein n=2 Tax=Cuscuta sect. Cleistogrammica TaxID=1824901 RepID=A0A484NCM3_9ASTE|nr:hypothetical protein DM860_017960 [Cuscuta australis]VFQ98962.1 unnamed protein product [Cuscuta campestris]